MNTKLLASLCCPATHQPLSIATSEVLTRLRERTQAGKAQTISGSLLKDEIKAGLLRQDGLILYPIRDGLPILLISEGIQIQ